jgi:hypothetical protein
MTLLRGLRWALLLVLVVGGNARAQSTPLQQYMAIRDSFATRVPAWPSSAKIDWKTLRKSDDSVRRLLAPLARQIVGPFDVPGFLQPGEFNVETLLPGEEDGYLTDGMRFRAPGSHVEAVVSTPELISYWRRKDAIRTLGGAHDLNFVFSSSSAVIPYASIPLENDTGVILALLIARQQDYREGEFPDEMLISLRRGKQLVVLEASLPAPVEVTGCENEWPWKPGFKKPVLSGADTLFSDDPSAEDAAYRACYAHAVVKDPRWPQIVARAAQMVETIRH